MNRKSLVQFLRDASEIVDEVMPWEWPVRNGKSAADRTELRKVALRVVFEALIAQDPPRSPPVPDDMELLTTAEVAAMCRVSAMTVYRWAADGTLKPVQTPSKRYRFRKTDVDALLKDPPEV